MTIGKVVDSPLLFSVDNGVLVTEDTELILECIVIGNCAAMHWVDQVETDVRYDKGSHVKRQTVDALCKKNNLRV